jgi:tetratricopeptide (TPR) repeat protein
MKSSVWLRCGWLAGFAFSLPAQDAASLYREGLRLFSQGKSEAAAASLQQSVALQPSDATAWKALGVVLASRGDYARAESAFGNACERQPALQDACLYYGRSLYLLDNFVPAMVALRGALKVSDTAEGHRLLALSLEALGHVAEAEPEFLAALRLGGNTPADEDPGIDYGVFLYRQGRTAQALGPLGSVLERHSDSARAHLELGCLLLSLDRLEEAAQHLERAVALHDSPRAHQLLGKTYLRQGKNEAAEAHLKR